VLASDIDYCSSICISKPRSPAAISFDVTHDQYTLIDVGTGSTLTHPMDGASFINDFQTGRNSQLQDVYITRVVSGAVNITALTFDSYGKPVLTADLVITLVYKTQTLTVTVKCATGDISISG